MLRTPAFERAASSVMPRIPLPLSLSTRSFHVREAQQLGLGRNRLRGQDVDRPHHGLRAGEARGPEAYLPLLRPGERFSHTTAAELWPLDLPNLRGPVHVTIATPDGDPRNPARGKGVAGHRSRHDDSVVRHGLPLSSPIAIFLELATLLGEDDLVAVGDALVLDPAVLDPHDIRPWISLEELAHGCAMSRRPGARKARRALAHIRNGAESRPETLLRLLMIRARLPEPELGQEVFDQRGRPIGRFDMVYRTLRVIVEYDGEQHRISDRQYDKDQVRIARAIAAQWKVVRVRKNGLFRQPAQTIANIREAMGA